MSCLIIFQKNATRGTVKTRIAATAGEDKALEIYNWLTSYTHGVAGEVKVDKFLFYSDFVPEDAEHHLPGYSFAVQEGGDLGERMSNAFRMVFSKGYSDAVIIGTDCPELHTSDLNSAFLVLSHNDLVIGPARDGGYYLLGMKGFYPQLFSGIPWSTATVLERTLDIADREGMDYEFLKIRSDVDTLEDWENFSSKTNPSRA
ncbi:TIGR04282 family arsenosugar biosynthesis glycosyltransferase [Algoriphagus sp. H41]|uniref:TIGR04282 family arsenosugar biosynthesis glycosyltransferase n=1 Tax=Algoriphagus oliviformis TaxID=2811231 RepID=A0ABS3C723_9BACT|nr:TIGR04282 family arsenosugar biosynthesis glycosyltransferase [Algoriphagus oliviformis]MBN7811930.1 TIGR04282 family arsenosugar biosynthesis glycosyltransferase [Algoriphagus oliviformis]